MAEMVARESFFTPHAHQVVDSAPYPPVHISPGAKLRLQLENVIVYIERRVRDMVVDDVSVFVDR